MMSVPPAVAGGRVVASLPPATAGGTDIGINLCSKSTNQQNHSH